MRLYKFLFIIVFLGSVSSSTVFGQQIFTKLFNKDYSVLLENELLEEPQSNWTILNRVGIDLSEVAFVNWNAGGSNSISGLTELIFERNYLDQNIKWKNKFVGRYGINSQEGRELRKTDDVIEYTSNFGYRKDTLSNWYYSAQFRFQTQLTNGYKYPNTTQSISQFMAPGYVFVGIGTEYGKRIENVSIYASPLTYKSTFVLDQRLANAGSFGVEGAELDAEGNIIKEGENVRSELGILLNSIYKAEVMENIALTNTLSLYTDYLNSFGNIDIDWELNFNFKVNSFVLAKLGSHLKYDNDVKISETNDAGEQVVLGARTQWKQQLGVGVIVDF